MTHCEQFSLGVISAIVIAYILWSWIKFLVLERDIDDMKNIINQQEWKLQGLAKYFNIDLCVIKDKYGEYCKYIKIEKVKK